MQTQKWVNLGLLLGSLLVFLLLGKLTVTIWDIARLPLMEGWIVPPPYVLSFVIAGGLGIWTRRNERANGFFNEVALELSRVTWPGRKETVASAGVVIVLISIASLILFVIDSLWGTMIQGIMTL